MPLGSSTLRLQSLRPNDDNTRIDNFYQVGPETNKKNSLSIILCAFLDGKAFEFLRTKNQLGYSVSFRCIFIQKIIGISLVVTSQEKKHKFDDVYAKMDIFVNEIAKNAVESMTDEELENVKNAAIKELTAPDLNIWYEVSRYYDEISDLTYDFNKREKLAEITKNITKLELIEFYHEVFDLKNKRKLSIQIIGNVNDNEDCESVEKIADYKVFTEKLSIDENLIENSIEFRNNLQFYPPTHKVLN